MLSYPLPILVVVRGQCLGGGLEVATAGSMIFSAPDGAFGQPEIKVGVFAPAASCILPARIGQARAEDLLLSGRSVDAQEALQMGLVNSLDDDPEAAALAYFDKNLAGHSTTVLRHAVKAARGEFAATVGGRLDDMEKIYLDGLMNTHDAIEGLQAFIDKRPAKWENK
jgi:cyclohexa-1,5-dienecarbonyl-CoA hydratase